MNRYSKFKIKCGLPLILMVALMSCKDFLEVNPRGRTVTPVVFADMTGMRSAVAGMYYKTYSLYTSYFYLYADLADNIIRLSIQEAATTPKELYDYETNTSSAGHWETIYDLLVNINNIIEYQPSLLTKNPDNKDELEIILGEALFMRALCHLNLCNLYAQPYNYSPDASHLGIPVTVHVPNYDSKPARDNVRAVYQQILADLSSAEQLLTDKSSRGVYYASLLSVYALKSRVYLYMEEWDSCIAYSSSVINNVPLADGDDYVSMFTLLFNKETEVIFRLNGDLNKSTTLMTLFNMSESYDDNGRQVIVKPAAVPSDGFMSMFDGNIEDIRYRELFFSATEASSGNIYYATNKFNVSDNSDRDYIHFNPIVLRCSEMYLNRAEAYQNMDRLTEAASDIRAVLARTYAKNTDEIIVEDTDKSILRKVIEDERIKELGFEGHKLFDTNRWKKDMVRDENTTSSIKILTYPNDLFVLPIPQRELDINENMIGNPTVNE